MNSYTTKWDARWQEKAQAPNWYADPWLQRVMPMLPKGRVLDVACGMGRNAIFLAEQGWQVTAVDVSEVALKLLSAEAQRRLLHVETIQLDLEENPSLPEGPFDLLINFFYLHRPLLAQELKRVTPGGVVVLRTFSAIGADRMSAGRPDISLAAGELLEIFAGWEVLLHEEGIEESNKGGTLAGIVARKPMR